VKFVELKLKKEIIDIVCAMNVGIKNEKKKLMKTLKDIIKIKINNFIRLG